MSLPDRRPSTAPDPAARPRPLVQRLQLLLILLVLPVAAVTLPTLAVTGIFGRQPKPKASKAPAHVMPTPASDPSGLAAALNHSAETLLPTPAPLTIDPIRVSVRFDHLTARAEKVDHQAKALGGSAVEGISAPGEKHLFVDLPAGRVEAFRKAVTANETPVPPPGTPNTGAARDQLEVIIRSAADDE